MRLIRRATVILLVVVAVVLFSACNSGGGAEPTPTPLGISASGRLEVIKPKPVVLGISATTSGIFEGYYTVLNVAVRNDGADGMVILIGSISQANKTSQSELPVYLTRNATENLKIIMPLKWRGGEWTPSVVAEIP